MSENMHTPGPWQLTVKPNGECDIDADGWAIAETFGGVGTGDGDNESYANARLIASAPTLAQKLQNCISALTFAIDGWDEADPYITKLRATRDGAQAALNEAQGTQS